MAEPTMAEPQLARAVAVSLDLKNSSLLSAALARWYVSPKTGASTAAEETWLKTMPRAMAEGLTGGRSGTFELASKRRLPVGSSWTMT